MIIQSDTPAKRSKHRRLPRRPLATPPMPEPGAPVAIVITRSREAGLYRATSKIVSAENALTYRVSSRGMDVTEVVQAQLVRLGLVDLPAA